MQVAAMLTGLHPQTLRKYEKVGLVSPVRLNTLRLYSEEDVALCRNIRRLVDEFDRPQKPPFLILKASVDFF